MTFLKRPWVWLLLAFGIWQNCEYNFAYMVRYGVDALSTLDLFGQAVVGCLGFVAVVALIALASGEKFEGWK